MCIVYTFDFKMIFPVESWYCAIQQPPEIKPDLETVVFKDVETKWDPVLYSAKLSVASQTCCLECVTKNDRLPENVEKIMY